MDKVLQFSLLVAFIGGPNGCGFDRASLSQLTEWFDVEAMPPSKNFCQKKHILVQLCALFLVVGSQ